MKSLRDLFLDSSAGRAMLAGIGSQPETKALGDRAAVTKQKGRRGKPNSRIIDYKRTGPFYQQTGTNVIAGNVLPLLKKYWVHQFLHATKGWRSYRGGALFHLPSAIAGPQGWQLFKRSTWRPNRAERKAGLVPRLNTIVQQGPEQDYAAGKAMKLAEYMSPRGPRIGFAPLVAAAA